MHIFKNVSRICRSLDSPSSIILLGSYSLENLNKCISDKFKQSIPASVKNFIRNNVLSNDCYDKAGKLSKVSSYYYEFKSLLDIVKEQGVNENKTV